MSFSPDLASWPRSPVFEPSGEARLPRHKRRCSARRTDLSRDTKLSVSPILPLTWKALEGANLDWVTVSWLSHSARLGPLRRGVSARRF